MIMPFADDFMALFQELRDRFSDKYVFTNAGDMDNQQNILCDIITGLAKADVVIADLTGLNANVFYELGLAHAMNKKVIIITQDIGELPFDIKAYRAYEYSLKFNAIPKLIDEIRKCLDGAMSGEIKFGSPVSDFAKSLVPIVETTNLPPKNKEEVQAGVMPEDEDTGELGFLDYSADFHDSTVVIVASLESIGTDLEAMSKSVEAANHDLEKAKASSKSLNPAFVRNLAKRLASPISEFAKKLHENTETISSQWIKAENCYLAMLDDPHIQTKENIEGVKTSVGSLKNMQRAIDNSNEPIEGFENSLRSCLGLERQLNKSLNATIDGLDQYLSITDSMKSSIDRMISRSNIAIERWDAEHKEETEQE